MLEEVVVALFLFVISMFGNLSALRFLRIFRSRALISTNVLTKIGTFACTTMNLGIFFCAHDARTAFIALVIALIAIFLALKLLERRQIDGLKNEIPAFLDRWILNMKLGHAVNTARDAALRDLDARNRALLQPLFASNLGNHENHLILDAKIARELLLLARHPHSALSRLENLRQMMRKSESFRRKSGQAVRQTTIQSSVLLILLVCLAIFTIQTRGWHENSDFIIISFLISAVGLAVMQKLARKTRWKI
jgi:Flp pilus assembly protein TadB